MSQPSLLGRFALSLLALTLALACDDDTPADAGPDSGATDSGAVDSGPTPTTCEEAPPALEAGDADGHPDPLNAPSGQTRAGRLTAAQVPEDRTGLGVWAAGDLVLANDRVALLIEDAGVSDLYDPHGGRPVGLARVSGGALVDAGDFNEILFGFGAYLVATESVTVLSDGSDGGPAVVRALGPLAPLEFAGELIRGVVPSDDHSGLPAAMDYEMSPGSDSVDVYLSVAQPARSAARVPRLLTAFFQRYRMPMWTEELGFTGETGATPMVAFVDDGAASYAWLAPADTQLDPVVDQSGVTVFSGGRATVPGCSLERFHLGTMVLGAPGLSGLQGALARRNGDALRTVTGLVSNADASPASDVRLHAVRADGSHFARFTPASDGTYSVDVPMEDVTLFAHRHGTPVVGPLSVTSGTATLDIDMPAVGTLRVTVTDGTTGDPIPARVQVLPMDGAPAVPSSFGERSLSTGRAHIAFTTGESVDLVVAPGEHDVIVSRGFEYELERVERVMVTAGAVSDVDVALERVVDTTGVLCADYHIHTHRSPDSPDSPERKLLSLIADGLEIAIRSDHEWANDFQPLIDELGLGAYARGLGGEELTTFAWGHFGVFPLTENPELPNGGAISWVGRLPPAVFADVRARVEEPVLIINHPRSGGALGGYFVAAGFNATTGDIANPDLWDDEFTLVEVFNDASFDDSRDGTVADWFALLNSGRRVFAVGSSDSHNLDSSPVGYPRTCLLLGTDDPASVTPDQVRDVTGAGHSVISGGVSMTVTGPGGSGPGDEVTGAGENASFDVEVQAASFVGALTELEVIVDGLTVETIPIPVDPPDPLNATVRLAATGISVPVATTGSWVVFHARSGADATLEPLHPGRQPFAVSNPVFLTR